MVFIRMLQINFIFFIITIFIPISVADEIHMKSGEIIKGKIVLESANNVKIKVDDVDISLTYYRDEIQDIVKDQEQAGGQTLKAVTNATVNSWKYTETESGSGVSKESIQSVVIGTEDLQIGSALYKGCLKEQVVTEDTNLKKGYHDGEKCIRWTSPDAGIVKETCSQMVFLKDGSVEEKNSSVKVLDTAQIGNMKFGE
ncbi:MAG: hypothetical protein WCI27_11875 [Candidatus Omnitrophota bacterium]